MKKPVFYFAYGANMNQSQAKKRGLDFNKCFKGWLKDYRLVFNVPEPALPGTGYANICLQKGSIVEGIIYETSEDSLVKIDQYEVVPTDYLRTNLTVSSDFGPINCFIYLGNEKILQNDLIPTVEYLNEIKEETHLLSPHYQNFLKGIKSYSNTDKRYG